MVAVALLGGFALALVDGIVATPSLPVTLLKFEVILAARRTGTAARQLGS